MIRLLADADFNHAIVKGCRRHEPALDFMSGNEANLEGVSDPEVLASAAELNRILVTHDRQTMPRHWRVSGESVRPDRPGDRRAPADLG